MKELRLCPSCKDMRRVESFHKKNKKLQDFTHCMDCREYKRKQDSDRKAQRIAATMRAAAVADAPAEPVATVAPAPKPAPELTLMPSPGNVQQERDTTNNVVLLGSSAAFANFAHRMLADIKKFEANSRELDRRLAQAEKLLAELATAKNRGISC